MLPLSKEESARLIALSKDIAAVTALKKLFLNTFIHNKGSALDIELLNRAFVSWEHLREKENALPSKGQVGL